MVHSAGGAASRVDADRAAARGAAPFCPFALQECGHSLFADERQVIHRRFAQRIIVHIAVFPLRRFGAGILRTLVAEAAGQRFADCAGCDPASRGTKFRFRVVGTPASGAGVLFAQRPDANAAIEAARGDHFCVKIHSIPVLGAGTTGAGLTKIRKTGYGAKPDCSRLRITNRFPKVCYDTGYTKKS